MNKLKSPWILAVLGILLGTGTIAAVLVMKMGKLEIAQPELVAEKIPDRIQWNFLTPAIEEMRADIESRLDSVNERETELKEYSVRLQAERAEIEKLTRDLEGMRAALADTFFEIQSTEEKNLKILETTYTGLSPTAALAIFREMDDETVVKILAFMKPEPVGRILEEMTQTTEGEDTLAGRAAVISNKLRLKRQVAAGENT
jgi:flagellar motility protein MotE (MotC chaperone)